MLSLYPKLTNNNKDKWERMKIELSIAHIYVECWFDCVLPFPEFHFLYLAFLNVNSP